MQIKWPNNIFGLKRDNLEYHIPKSLSDDQRITILRTDDYGPATKLFGVLEAVDLPSDTIIITVDDDVIYPNNLILELAYAARKHPNDAIGIEAANINYDGSGKIIEEDDGRMRIKTPGSTGDMLLGYAGVAYRRNFFDDSIFDHKNAPKECYVNDDLYIGFYLETKGVPRRQLNSAFLRRFPVFPTELGKKEDALFILTPNRWATNTVCIRYLKSLNPEVNF